MTSVSQVETSSPTGPLLHTSKADIEHQLGAAFSHHFQGANGTPFLSAPLLHCVGMDSSSSATCTILEGTFVCPLEVDEFTRQFISTLHCPPMFPPEPASFHYCHQLPGLLALCSGTYLFFLLWPSLWPLQGHCHLPHPVQNPCYLHPVVFCKWVLPSMLAVWAPGGSEEEEGWGHPH